MHNDEIEGESGAGLNYEVHGTEMQMVEIELAPDQTIIAEAGAMSFMEDGITYEAKMGDGSRPDQGLVSKLFSAGKRMLTGESLFMTHFTNHATRPRRVAFAAPYPGRILPINLAKVGGELTCQKDTFLCATLGTEVSIAFQRKLGTGLFGGEGFIMQKLRGDGLAFLHAGGTVLRRELNGETLRVDTGCLVGFTEGIDYDIERAGSLKSMVFGGEGLFLATLRGHGLVLLQSLPFSRLAGRVLANAQSAGGGKGEGSILGGLGDLFGDSE